MERRRYIAPTYPVMSKTETTPKRHSENTHYTKELSSSNKVNRLREEEQEKCEENQSSLQCYKEEKKQDELAESHAVSHNLRLKRPRSLLKEFSLLQSDSTNSLESNNTQDTLAKQHIPQVSTTETHRVTSRWKLPMPNLVNKHHINKSVIDNTNLVSSNNSVNKSVTEFNTTCTPSPELEANKVNKTAVAGEELHNINVISEYAILDVVDNTSSSTNNNNAHQEEKEDDSNSDIINVDDNDNSDDDNIDNISSNNINHHNCIATYRNDPNVRFIYLPRKYNVITTSVVENKCKENCEPANDQQIATRKQEWGSESMHHIDKLTQHKTNLCKDDKKAIKIAEHILLEQLRSFTSDTYDKREGIELEENKEFCEEEVKSTHFVKERQADYVGTELNNNTNVNNNHAAGAIKNVICNNNNNNDGLENKHDRHVEPYVPKHMSDLIATQVNHKTMSVAAFEPSKVNFQKEDNIFALNVNDLVEQYKLIKRTLRKLAKSKEHLCSKDINVNDSCQSNLVGSKSNNDKDYYPNDSTNINDEKCNSQSTHIYCKYHRDNGCECECDKVSNNYVSSGANMIQLLEVCKTQETLLLEEQREYIASMELCERNATQSRASFSSFFDSRYGDQHE